MAKISTTVAKGVHVTFNNGITISAQWGAGNYADNYHSTDFSGTKDAPASSTVELAFWDKDNNWYDLGCDQVYGRFPVDKLPELFLLIKNISDPTLPGLGTLIYEFLRSQS